MSYQTKVYVLRSSLKKKMWICIFFITIKVLHMYTYSKLDAESKTKSLEK